MVKQGAPKDPANHQSTPGSTSLCQVRHYQKDLVFCINKRGFQDVLRHIAQSNHPNMKFSVSAVEAIQHAAENHIVSIFMDSSLCTAHAGRITATAKDFALALRLCSRG